MGQIISLFPELKRKSLSQVFIEKESMTMKKELDSLNNER